MVEGIRKGDDPLDGALIAGNDGLFDAFAGRDPGLSGRIAQILSSKAFVTILAKDSGAAVTSACAE